MAVPGLTGRHTIGGVVLGDLTTWPRYRLSRITGLKTLPDLEDARDLPAGRTGELARTAVRRGKTIIYEGVVEGRSSIELEQAIDALTAATAPTVEQRVAVAPILGPGTARPWQATDAVLNPLVTPRSYFYTARVTGFDPPEERIDGSVARRSRGHERSFVLALRLSDPRFYADPGLQAQTAAVTAGAGASLPWVFPVVVPAATLASGVVAVTNAGNAPADFAVDLVGPAVNPGIQSDTLALQVRLALQVPAGQFVRIDFRSRSVLLNGVEDVRASIDRDQTTWWDGDLPGLRPGVNQLRYLAEGLTDPAVAIVRWNDAYWS